MPESAARINPLRPRVCTIHLCLGEPPLRGARVRADSLVLCSSLTRTRSYTRRNTRAHNSTLVTLTRTYTSVGTRRAYGVMGARPPSSTPAAAIPSKREGYLWNPRRLSTTDLAMFPDPCRDWSRIRRTASPIRRSRPRLRAAHARTTSFTGE